MAAAVQLREGVSKARSGSGLLLFSNVPAPWLHHRFGPRLVVASVTLMLACASSLAAEDVGRYIEVIADIETFRYKLGDDLREGKNPIRDSYPVVCVFGTNEWQINIPFSEKMNQWTFDGTNLVETITGPRRPLPPLGPTFQPTVTNTTNTAKALKQEIISGVHVWESRDGCPLDDALVNVPWLAFCSAGYLKRAGRVVPYPIIDLRHSPDGFGFTDKTTTFPDSLGLPQSIDLFASDALFAASVTNGAFKGKKDVEFWKKGAMGFKWLAEGTRRFHYVVTETTNCSGWNVPTRFEWHLNIPESGKLIPLGIGKVTSLREVLRPQVVLATNMRTTVVDWRFQDSAKGVQAIVYRTESASVEPVSNPRLQAKFAAERQKGNKGRKTGWIPLALVVLIVPGIVLFLKNIRNKVQPQSPL